MSKKAQENHKLQCTLETCCGLVDSIMEMSRLEEVPKDTLEKTSRKLLQEFSTINDALNYHFKEMEKFRHVVDNMKKQMNAASFWVNN